MEHRIYDLLDTYELVEAPTRRQNLQRISLDDLNILLDELDQWYEQQREQLAHFCENSDMFSVWLPRTRVQSLAELSARFVVADRVMADDTLYNHFVMLSEVKSGSFFETVPRRLPAPFYDEWRVELTELLSDHASRLIDFYILAKDLVRENQFIPFIDARATQPASESEAVIQTLLSTGDIGDALEKFARVQVNDLSSAEILFARRLFNEATVDATSLASSLWYSLHCSHLPLPGIDFLDDGSLAMFNRLVGSSHSGHADSPKSFFAPLSENTLHVPSLGRVPLAEIPEFQNRRKDSLLKFKQALISKMASISSIPGTEDWEREILKARAELTKDVADIEMCLQEAKQDFHNRLAIEVTSLAFSIAIAAFGVSGAQGNPLGLIPTVAGGAGLMASIRAITSNWLGFRKEKSALERRDSYYLWQLRK